MNETNLNFDEVFTYWLASEVKKIENRDLLLVAKEKGFNSISEWRLQTALRLRLDTKSWKLVTIDNPNQFLPNIIIGPYQGWSLFFNNQLTTSFNDAMQIAKFKDWCSTHDRIIPISKNFPFSSTLILLQKSNGQYIHIEGGHRICAATYLVNIGQPLDFNNKPPLRAAVAPIADEEIPLLKKFLKEGTFKQTAAL